MTPKNRSKTNFYIDLIMFVVMGALIGIGILIKYVLIPGQQRWALFGQNMELTFLGLDRHQWGTIHLVLGGILVLLLILHLIFHWNMIKCLFKKCVEPVGRRRLISILSLVLFVIFAAFPLFVTPKKQALDRGESRNVLENMGVDLNDSIRIRLKKPKNLESGELELEVEHKKPGDDIRVKGSMTLQEVSSQYNVDLETLKEELDLPQEIRATERLGVLRKEYGFTMGDVKTVILRHGK